MPSYQSGGPSSKFDKIKSLDPLDPFAPFTAQPGDEPEVVERVVTEHDDSRLRLERPVGAAQATRVPPTSTQQPAVQQPAIQQPMVANTQTQQQHIKTRLDLSDRIDYGDGKKGHAGEKADVDEADSDDDEYYLEGLDDDPALTELRQRRLAELKIEHERRSEQLAIGHGDYRTISQDEFLSECTGSSKYHVVVHFFHKEFERCKIMDHHLRKIAPLHLNCKFLRIDAEKSPFFVGKLQVRTLPTVIVFLDGKAVNRLTGFDGLVSETRDPDEWRTSQLLEWLDSVGAIEYDGDDPDDQDDGERTLRQFKQLGLSPSVQRAFDEDL